MKNAGWNRKKNSHSRFAQKKCHARPPFKRAKKYVAPQVVVPICVEEKLTRKQKIQKAKQERLDRIVVSKEHANALKQSFEILRDDVEKENSSLKQQIKQMKVQQKENRLKMKEAKKQLRSSKKDIRQAKKRNAGIPTSILAVFFFTFSFFLWMVVRWLIRTWPNLKMDELVYEATAPLAGTGSNMVEAFIQQCVYPTLAVLVVVIAIVILVTKLGKLTRRIGKIALNIVSVICIAIAGTSFWNHLDIGTYVENQTQSSDFIKTEYVDPSNVQLTFPEQKRNLIYIYLESMEMTYADKANGGALDQNVIPKLTKLSEANENFSGTSDTLNGAYSMPSTTWTMGGIFAATSGLPLQTSLGRNAMDTQTSFFPSITTLGDILSEQGYRQYFACGSDVTFGGRKVYLETHGSYTLHDYVYARDTGIIPYGYYVWWGMEDRHLFEMVKKDLTELGNSDEPFNYTLLTVDTHFEDGYADAYTQDRFNGNQYSNVIFHSDEQVMAFLDWCKTQSWYDNTTIVLSGDHPTMDSDYLDDIDSSYDRRVYTTYINSAVETEKDGSRIFTTFDNFPTTLAAMGVEIDGDRLGLGTNLFSSKQTLSEKYGLEKEISELNKKSSFMTTLASADATSTSFQEFLSDKDMHQAVVRLENYDDEKKTAEISVDDIFFVNGEIDYVSLVVTHPDGKKEYIRCKHRNQGQYTATIDVSDGGLENQSIVVEAHTRINGSDALRKQDIFTSGGNLALLSTNSNDLLGYIRGLRYLDQSRYAIVMTTQGNALVFLSDAEKEELMELGIPKTFLDDSSSTRFALLTRNDTIMKKGSGYIRDYGTLPNGAMYTIASANAVGAYATINIGDYFNNYTNYKDGIHFAVYDMARASVVSQFEYDTSTVQYQGNLYVSLDEETKTLQFDVTDTYNIDEGQIDVEVVLWNKKKLSEKIDTGLSSTDNSHFSVTLSGDGFAAEDVYVVAYLKSRNSDWHRFAEGNLKDLIQETEKNPLPTEEESQEEETVNEP